MMTEVQRLRRLLDAAEKRARVIRGELDAEMVREYRFRPGDILRNPKGRLCRVSRVYVEHGAIECRVQARLESGDYAELEVFTGRREWVRLVLHHRPEGGSP